MLPAQPRRGRWRPAPPGARGRRCGPPGGPLGAARCAPAGAPPRLGQGAHRLRHGGQRRTVYGVWGRSSKPVTETSWGTRSPDPAMAPRAPMAMASLPQTIPVGRSSGGRAHHRARSLPPRRSRSRRGPPGDRPAGPPEGLAESLASGPGRGGALPARPGRPGAGAPVSKCAVASRPPPRWSASRTSTAGQPGAGAPRPARPVRCGLRCGRPAPWGTVRAGTSARLAG